MTFVQDEKVKIQVKQKREVMIIKVIFVIVYEQLSLMFILLPHDFLVVVLHVI